MSEKSLQEKVEKLIQQVQPALGLHGGAIELVEVTPDKVVKIRFKGACVGCAAADLTLEYGLKEMLMLQLEEIADVVSVNDEAVTHAAPIIPLGIPHA